MTNLSTNHNKRRSNDLKSSLDLKKIFKAFRLKVASLRSFNLRTLDIQSLFNLLAVFTGFMLVVILTSFIFAGPESSDATTVTASAGSSVYYASISNDNSVSIPITPTSSQAEYTATSDITFSNTCTSGSYVYLNTSTSDNNLTRSGSDTGTKTISPIEAGVSGLENNTWGFKVDGKAFSQVPSSSDTPAVLYSSTTNETNTAVPVTYGVKTDSNLPSGSYTNNVIYTVSVPTNCTVYTLKFDANGGSIINSSYNYNDQTIEYGTMINLSNYKPQRTGYTFAGWSKTGSSGSAAFNGTETSVNVNSSNAVTLTLTALWTANNYSITLNGNSATTQNTATVYTKYNTNLYLDSNRSNAMTTSANAITIPVRTGYTFDGYYSGSGGTGTQYISATGYATSDGITAAKGYTSNSTWYAKWTANNYTITLNGNSATTQNTATLYTTYNTNLYLNSARSQAMTTSAYPITIPVRTNYTFEGYYSGSGGTGTQYITSSGYATSAGITAAKGYTSNQTWYAKWTLNAVGIHSISTMQAMTSTICSASTTPAASATTLDTTGAYHGNTSYVPSTTLTDSRDSKTYTVRKLADGKCWMTQNLRLIGSRTLTSSNSNVSSNFTLPASISSWTSTYTAAMVYDTGNTEYGVYYNYYAATAGTVSGDSNSTAASYSVCPKGWKLPTQAQYTSLLSAYSVTNDATGSSKMRSTPLNFVYSGHHNTSGTTLSGQGSYGDWWSATASSATDRHGTYVSSGYAHVNRDVSRAYGFAVRCVAQ